VVWKCYDGLGHWYKISDEIVDMVDLRSTIFSHWLDGRWPWINTECTN
jgi:hypothetical protein